MAAKSEKEKVRITKSNLTQALKVFKYIAPYKWYFIGGMTLLVFGSLVFMAIPAFCSEMANAADNKSRFPFSVNQIAIGLVFLLVGQGIFAYLRTLAFAVVSEKGMADIRKELYEKMMCQSFTFYESSRIGELTSRLTTDIEQLQAAFSITLAEFLRQIVTLISGIAILAYIAPKLSLTMLATFPVVVVVAMIFGRYIRKLSKERQGVLADANTIVDETLQSFSAVKSYANEWYEQVRYAGSVDKIVAVSLRFAKIRGLFIVFIITFLFGGIIFILWRGAIYVQQGDMTVGDLFSFVLYTGILGGALAGLGSLYTTLASAIGATERVMEIIESDTEVVLADSKGNSFSRFDGDVEFKNVDFQYPSRPDIEVLKKMNLTIKKGQKVALVGQSGSGKSTIVQLLMRFYEPSGGSIIVDGNPIGTYNVSGLRKNIGIVPQEVILFGGTIKENILYGKPDATDEEVRVAAVQSNSWEFIDSFPEKMDTIVGERGIKLSGGQRQRIAIARAILKDPSILILDEATSALDAESEKVVQEALDVLMEGRTSIIIAHRLATIREVDHIYVIEKGKIIEEGNHSVLMEIERGVYRSLANLQFEIT